MNNVDDLRIIKATAKTGSVHVRVVSTVEDTMFFDYLIPDGKKDGLPFELHERIPPAPSGGSIERIFEYPVDGYTFDLSGQPQVNLYNAFYSELTGRIDSTGKLVNLSLDDSILIYIKLSGFVPEYFEGYAGSNQVSFGPESAPLKLFNAFGGGSIDFELVKVSVSAINGNGVPFEVQIDELKASNKTSGKSIDLDLSALPSPLPIGAAIAPSQPWRETWQLGNSANLNEALNIYPDQITASLTVQSNPEQDSTALDQFAIDSAVFESYLDLAIPLSLTMNDLILRDTVEMSFSSEDFAQVQGATFYLIAHNQLPMNAALSVSFIDELGGVLGTLQFDKEIEAGSDVKRADSVMEVDIDATFLDDIALSRRAVLSATLNTPDGAGHQTIYSDQELELTLSARFQMQTELE
jgi:hypothetical protein